MDDAQTRAAAESPMDDAQTRAAAETVYTYAHMNHSLERTDGKAWDGVLCLCSSDLRVAKHAAELHNRLGGWLCFSGGMGTGPHSGANLLGWTEPEAVIFANEAARCGVPNDSILIEPAASNTGENVSLSRALLASRGLACERVVIVQKPFMERRSWATLKRVWPEADAVISSPRLSLQACVDGCGVPADVLIAIMVGDLQRIRLYALPPRQFQIAQPIPRAVWDAYTQLVQAGFVMNVVTTDAPLAWEPSWEQINVEDGCETGGAPRTTPHSMNCHLDPQKVAGWHAKSGALLDKLDGMIEAARSSRSVKDE